MHLQIIKYSIVMTRKWLGNDGAAKDFLIPADLKLTFFMTMAIKGLNFVSCLTEDSVYPNKLKIFKKLWGTLQTEYAAATMKTMQ